MPVRLHNEALIICFLIIGAAFSLTLWQTTPSIEAAPIVEVEPEKQITIDAADISAQAFVVFDVGTGRLLASKSEHEVVPVASVTKLFTAATALNYSNLEQTTIVTWDDVAAEGRAGKLHVGERYTVRELLWPLMLESSNDAAAALERVLPHLLVNMNANVRALGAEETQFADGSGLSANNVSTAAELARLTRKLYATEPHLFDITRLKQYIGSHTGWVNNSPFADDASYLGGKHGYTEAAGRTGIFIFEEGGMKLGYILLGSADLEGDIQKLRP